MSKLMGFVILLAFVASNASFFTSASELDPMAENQDYAPFEGRWGNFEDELTSSPATDNETNDAVNDSKPVDDKTGKNAESLSNTGSELEAQIVLGSSEEITLLCNTTNTKGWSARNHSYCSGRVTVPNPPPASVSLTLLGLDSTEFEGIKVKLGTTELSSVDQIKNTFTGAVVVDQSLSNQKQLLTISFNTKNPLEIPPVIRIIWGAGNSSPSEIQANLQADVEQKSNLEDSVVLLPNYVPSDAILLKKTGLMNPNDRTHVHLHCNHRAGSSANSYECRSDPVTLPVVKNNTAYFSVIFENPSLTKSNVKVKLGETEVPQR
eukprot:944_1